MEYLMSFLNYQPFGDWGVMSIFSIRMFHIIFGIFIMFELGQFLEDLLIKKDERK